MGSTAAILNGTIVNNGGAPVTNYYFYYTDGVNPPISVGSGIVVSGNNFSVPVTGLTPGAQYHFSAYALNSSTVDLGYGQGWGRGGDVYFTTSSGAITQAPTISPGGGTYSHKKGVKAKLCCGTPGATIYYTTNGADPTTSSSRYPYPCSPARKNKGSKKNKGLKLKGPKGTTIVVKAMAIANGSQSSIQMAVFTFK